LIHLQSQIISERQHKCTNYGKTHATTFHLRKSKEGFESKNWRWVWLELNPWWWFLCELFELNVFRKKLR
jgi:hypothetical protein